MWVWKVSTRFGRQLSHHSVPLRCRWDARQQGGIVFEAAFVAAAVLEAHHILVDSNPRGEEAGLGFGEAGVCKMLHFARRDLQNAVVADGGVRVFLTSGRRHRGEGVRKGRAEGDECDGGDAGL